MGWGTFLAGQAIGSARRAGKKKPLYPSDVINPDYLIYHRTFEDNKMMWLCAVGGWAGVHRFIVRKHISGILFLSTFGLFGVGWAIDFYKIVMGNFEFIDGLTGRQINPSRLKPLIPLDKRRS
jgi:hypothetical protein